jgi:hypothetical protein
MGNFTCQFQSYIKEAVSLICSLTHCVRCIVRSVNCWRSHPPPYWFDIRSLLSPSFVSFGFRSFSSVTCDSLQELTSLHVTRGTYLVWSFHTLPVVLMLRPTERAFIRWFTAGASGLYWNTWPSLNACSVACERFFVESLTGCRLSEDFLRLVSLYKGVSGKYFTADYSLFILHWNSCMVLL